MLERLLTLSNLYFDEKIFKGSPGELFLRIIAEAFDEVKYNVRALQNRSFALTVQSKEDLERLAHLNGISISPFAQGIAKAEVLISYPIAVTSSISDLRAFAPELLYLDALVGDDYFYTTYVDFRDESTRIITTSLSLIYSKDVILKHGRVERRIYTVGDVNQTFLNLELEEDVIDVVSVFVEYEDTSPDFLGNNLVKYYRSRNLHELTPVENINVFVSRHIYDVIYKNDRINLLFGRKFFTGDDLSMTGYAPRRFSKIYVDVVSIDPSKINSFVEELNAKVNTVKINNRFAVNPSIQVLNEAGYTTRIKDLESLKREVLALLNRDEIEAAAASYFDKYRIFRENNTVVVEGAVLRNGNFTFTESDRYFMQSILSLYRDDVVVREIPITDIVVTIKVDNVLNEAEIKTFTKNYINNLKVSGIWVVNELVGLLRQKFNIVASVDLDFPQRYASYVNQDIVKYVGVLNVKDVIVKPLLIR